MFINSISNMFNSHLPILEKDLNLNKKLNGDYVHLLK